MEKRKIPTKNYLILGLISIVTVVLLYYFYSWTVAYKETKLNKRMMDAYMEVINYNELDNYLVESPDTIIYVSVLENEEIREFEKKFKDAFKKKEIENSVLYMDITNELKDEKLKQEMQTYYKLNDIDITNVPAIVVFSGGKLKSIYAIGRINYDVKQVKAYINGIKMNDEDLIDG